MSKSTPLTQLPNVPQQIQMAPPSQAAAVQSFVMPQNTQTSSDIVNEDDNTINEVLQQLNGGNNAQQMQAPQQQPIMPPTQPQAPQVSFEEMMNMQQAQQQMKYMHPMMHQQPGMFADMAPTYGPSQIEEDLKHNTLIDNIENIQHDIKNVVVVVVVFVIATVIPIERLANRYIAFEKIPFSNIAIKAALAGALFFAISKLI